MAQNERLRAALLRSGKTAAELAEAAGVDPQTFERWITKGRTPHRVNAARAAAAGRFCRGRTGGLGYSMNGQWVVLVARAVCSSQLRAQAGPLVPVLPPCV